MTARSIWCAGLLWLAACSGNAKQVSVAEAAEEKSAEEVAEVEPVEEPPSLGENEQAARELESLRCASRTGEDDVLVLSTRDGYATLLSGTNWLIQCDEEKLFAAESDSGAHVSIRDYRPEEPVVLSDRLQQIAGRVVSKMRERGFPASEPNPVTIRTGHQTVDAVFVSIDLGQVAKDTVQLNYFTSRQRDDGMILDFHMSAIVPMNQPQEMIDATILTMERTTGLFSLLADLGAPE